MNLSLPFSEFFRSKARGAEAQGDVAPPVALHTPQTWMDVHALDRLNQGRTDLGAADKDIPNIALGDGCALVPRKMGSGAIYRLAGAMDVVDQVNAIKAAETIGIKLESKAYPGGVSRIVASFKGMEDARDVYHAIRRDGIVDSQEFDGIETVTPKLKPFVKVDRGVMQTKYGL